MLQIDRKNKILKYQGDIPEIMSDIGLATMELVDAMVSNQISQKDWNETFEYVIKRIIQAVKLAHEAVLNGEKREDVSFGGGYKQ